MARYRSPTTFEYVEEECFDVSVGGMFIRSVAPAAAGTLLKLECESDMLGNKIRGVARVVWLRRDDVGEGPGGMGVKFVKLEGPSRTAIEEIVRRTSASEMPPFVDDARAEPAVTAEVINMVVAPQTLGTGAVMADVAASAEPVPSWRPDAPGGRKVWGWTLAGMAAFAAIVSSDWFLGPSNRVSGTVKISESVAAEIEAAKVAPPLAPIAPDLAPPTAFAAFEQPPQAAAVEAPTPQAPPSPLAMLPLMAAAAKLPGAVAQAPAAPTITPAAVASSALHQAGKRSVRKAGAAKAAATKNAAKTAAAASGPVVGPTPAAPPGAITGAAGRSPLEIATACLGQGDNACVIDALQGKARSAREYELLIETLRAVGRSADARRQMLAYVARFPGERRASGYQRQLETQGERPATSDRPAAPEPNTPAAP